MSKYRAVLMVPTIVEFEFNIRSDSLLTRKIREIADGMGKCESMHPRHKGEPYEPKVLEVVKVEDGGGDDIERAAA